MVNENASYMNPQDEHSSTFMCALQTRNRHVKENPGFPSRALLTFSRKEYSEIVPQAARRQILPTKGMFASTSFLDESSKLTTARALPATGQLIIAGFKLLVKSLSMLLSSPVRQLSYSTATALAVRQLDVTCKLRWSCNG